MVAEILIVGDQTRREGLANRVAALGYEVASCPPEDVRMTLSEGGAPRAIVVSTEGSGLAALMGEIRRTPLGAAVPVTLCGQLGGEIRDLADVLDLGADHFIEEPVLDDQLEAALGALAGPPEPKASPPPAESASQPEASDPVELQPAAEGWPSRTEVIAGADTPPPKSPSGSGKAEPGERQDAVIGQLHRTLDLLEERLRKRDLEAPSASDSADELDLSMMGIDATPNVEELGDIPDPGDSGAHLRLAQFRPQAPATRRPTPREPTVRLEDGPPGIEADIEVPAAEVAPATPAPASTGMSELAADYPRRVTPLPVDREGDLGNIEVPRLLWKLYRGTFTGLLVLTRGRVDKKIWLHSGAIVFASSNVGQDRLNDGLLRRGLLTRDQYDTARRLAAKEPRRAGQLLVEAGFLKSGELPGVIRDHLIHIVDSTFPYHEGTWSLEPDARCDEAVQLDVPMPLLLVDGVRNRMEAAQLWALLGGPEQHPRLLPQSARRSEALVLELGLTEEDQRLIGLLDGRSSLQQLTQGQAVDELDLLGLVYALHILELVDLVGEPQPEAKAGQSPAQVDRQRIIDRLRLIRESDYFAVLGLPRHASRVDVRRAYRELRKTFRDEALDPETSREMSSQLRELRFALEEAMRLLSDDALRSTYLAHLEEP